jgi:hypothetical protein
MQRFETINDFENAIDQCLACSIAQVTQRLTAAEMGGVEGITTRTLQRAFPRDLEGERRPIAP